MPWTSDFIVSHEKPPTVRLIDSSDGKSTATACNNALERLVARVVEQCTFRGFDRASSECFRIMGSQLPIHINRTASAIFGTAVQGVHMVVYKRTEDQMKIWVPRRAPTLFSYPDLLDSAVGGGVQATQSPMQAIIQEADEEASLPGEYLRKHMRSCGALTYMSCTDDRTGYENGLMVPEVVYVYELEISSEMELKPKDGEVERYTLMDVDEIAQCLKTHQFKPSSAAVMVDFFIRHGIITDENEVNYLSLVEHIHRDLPIAISRLSGGRL
ncbi:NUDIX domain-containing protein [Pyrenophora tritici-repentis]|nr:NUDIX domain-containing protein [Pyrenophora tritici-repentis]